MNQTVNGVSYIYDSRVKRIILLTTIGILFYVMVYHAKITCDNNSHKEECMFCVSNQTYLLKQVPTKYSPRYDKLTDGDYYRLINLPDFNFIINQPNKCPKSYVLLLMVISSASENHERRETIRATWGKEDIKVKRVFLIGAVTDNKIQSLIQEEDRVHMDIVQGNFMDSYENLTYKTIMALKYSVYHCSNAVYILKLDDNVFVNTPLLKNYLNTDLSPFGAENLLQCVTLKDKPSIKNQSSNIPEQEYPFPLYPTHCRGSYALFSPDIVFNLYKEAQKLPFFFLEDVFTYVFAASKVKGLHFSDIYHQTLDYEPTSRERFDANNFLFGTVNITNQDIVKMWNYVISRPVRISIHDNTTFF